MTSQPSTRPEVEKVGGGISARAAAVVAVALLAGLTWIGLSGRSDTPPPEASPIAAVPAAPSPIPQATQRPVPERADSPGPRLDQGYFVEVPGNAPPAQSLARPQIEARLVAGRLHAAVGLGGRPAEGPMTAHVLFHGRYGPTAELQLLFTPDGTREEATEAEVLVGIELERRLLRRGFPEEFRGDFLLGWPDAGEAQPWRYRAYPLGTGSGILLVIEAEPLIYEALERQDLGGRDGGSRVWSCWSHGQVC